MLILVLISLIIIAAEEESSSDNESPAAVENNNIDEGVKKNEGPIPQEEVIFTIAPKPSDTGNATENCQKHRDSKDFFYLF